MTTLSPKLRGRIADVIGTPCLLTDYAALREDLHQWVAAAGNGSLSIDFTNVHIAALRAADPAFAQDTRSVDAFIPDSAVLARAANYFAGTASPALYGPRFMADFLRDSPQPFRHYFLGGTDELLRHLRTCLMRLQPGLDVAGMHHGYLAADGSDDEAVIEEINTLSPDFIWVGMGTPRQQRWIHRNKSRVHRGVLLAVGFAFDVNSGMKSDAPEWAHPLGLTWLFRFLSEPRRLGARYLRYNARFLFELTRQWLWQDRRQQP